MLHFGHSGCIFKLKNLSIFEVLNFKLDTRNIINYSFNCLPFNKSYEYMIDCGCCEVAALQVSCQSFFFHVCQPENSVIVWLKYACMTTFARISYVTCYDFNTPGCQNTIIGKGLEGEISPGIRYINTSFSKRMPGMQ